LALRDLLKKTDVVLLEPVFKVEVSSPDEFIGSIVGDLNSRRGKILSMSAATSGGQLISAEVPLAQLFGYATDIRSLSQGRAFFNMSFLQYAVLPARQKNEVLQKLGR
jgi:elongation factor G